MWRVKIMPKYVNKTSIEFSYFSGQTALHCAILAHGKPKKNGEGSIDSIPIIQALIKKGADPSAQVIHLKPFVY